MEQNLTPIIKESFLQYAGAVLQSRALVDVRDCIKPSARQIFYCMYTDKFVHSKPFQKTLKAIGSAFRMYIHGDASAEGIIMRAGQPFSMRYPLVEVEGSYGTLLASGSWAAPRYTAARLSPLAEYLFADLNKQVVEEWRDNYDNTEKYPTVLPSKGFFNLVNGSFGIAVGASSSIPQYNLREVNEALIKLIDNPDCSFDEIYCAPDFATGATIINAAQVRESHKNGSGFACKIRSTVEWDARERCFVVTEIPYMVYTETICKELEDIINGEDNFGIERFNDLTGVNPLIKIYLTKTANPDKVLVRLFKETSLESYYSINFTMLENGRFPKQFTWKEILQAHIGHEKVIYRRGFEFDLRKIRDRLHIIDGLLICLANIEEVVRIIKSSSSPSSAAAALQKQFLLDEAQTKAILDMKLSRLAHLEVQKLENEKNGLIAESERIESILNDEQKFNNELKNGWREVAQKFGDKRRTKILDLAATSDDAPIEKKKLSLSFTSTGAVFIDETSTLYTQRRNGVGNKFKLEPHEYVVDHVVGDNTDTILFFTNRGNFYHMKLGEFTIGQKEFLSNFVSIGATERIVAAAVVPPQSRTDHILFVTERGIVKKSDFSEYNLKRKMGMAAIKLDEGDEIVSVCFTDNECLGIATHKGQFVRFATNDIRSIGRVARGVIGIRLNEGDRVVSARIVPKETTSIVSVGTNGLIKQSPISEFPLNARGGKGVKIQQTDSLSDFLPILSEKDITVTTSHAQLRLSLSEVPTHSRGTVGVSAIKLKEGSSVISLAKF